MNLRDDFSFNQQNLQDYIDCPKRFLLKHIQCLEWPAIESEPVREQEELLDLGSQFHKIVQQHGSGIPSEQICKFITNPILGNWWEKYLQLNIQNIPGKKSFEKMLSVPFHKFRLVAKFDLIVELPHGEVAIFDWKTSQKKPNHKWLKNRMQTKVYPLVYLISKLLPAAKAPTIKLSYWYPAYPQDVITFIYSPDQYQADEIELSSLINQIVSLKESDFNKTENTHLCLFCRYRSLCSRGEKAGNIQESDSDISDSAFDIDFDQLNPAE